MAIDKAKLSQQVAELRGLWNEWQPIGPSCPPDEYDSYVGPMLSLLYRGAQEEELREYVAGVLEHMGLPFAPGMLEFVSRVEEWYEGSAANEGDE